MTTDVINVPRELRSVLSMILSALDRYAAEGKTVRGEMAEELRRILTTAQPAADGEREAFEAYCQTIGYTLKTGDSGHYLGGYGAEIWAGWKARAAQPQQAVAVADEVRKVVQGLPYQMLFNAIADSVRITGDGHAVSISVKWFKSAIDAALSAHKTGEEE